MRTNPASKWHDTVCPLLMASCRQHILSKSSEEEWKRAKAMNCVYPKPQIILFKVEGQILWLTHMKIMLKFTEDNGINVKLKEKNANLQSVDLFSCLISRVPWLMRMYIASRYSIVWLLQMTAESKEIGTSWQTRKDLSCIRYVI